MNVVLIKKILANGLASAESIQLERKLRASSLWAQMENPQLGQLSCTSITAEDAEPVLVVKDGDTTEVFTDLASFEQSGRRLLAGSRSLEAACW